MYINFCQTQNKQISYVKVHDNLKFFPFFFFYNQLAKISFLKKKNGNCPLFLGCLQISLYSTHLCMVSILKTKIK